MEKEIFNLPDAAEYLGCTRRWLRENCVELGIEHARIGKKFRFERQALDRFIAQHRRRAKAGVFV